MNARLPSVVLKRVPKYRRPSNAAMNRARTLPLAVRLERFLSPEPNTGCLLFTGCVQSRGYGSIGITRTQTALAHRVAWELERGPIQDGLTLDHTCGGPLICCNTKHLQLVTREENSALAWVRRRERRLAEAEVRP